MKKIQGFLACIVAVAAGVSIAGDESQANGVTPFDSLKLSAATNSFSASVSGTSENVSGCTVSKADGKVTVAENYYVIESDLSETTVPLAIAQNPKVTNSIEKFGISFKASFVDEADLGTATAVSGAKIGFALTGADAASYYDGTVWKTLTDADDVVKLNVTEDVDYVLHIDYDAREATKKARFVLDTTPAYTSQWVTVGVIANNTIAVLGAGSVKSLAGANYTIEAEVIIITPPGENPVNIELTPAQMAAVATLSGVDPADPTSVSTALFTQNSANDQPEIANLALFGKVGAQITSADKLRVEGVTKTSDVGKIGVKFGNINPQAVTGATVKYRLMGKNGSEWTQIGTDQDSDVFEFDASTPYRTFKIQAVINYTPAN